MKCARLHLQDRAKFTVKRVPSSEKPRRYCQKRMANPDNCEDPPWTDASERFYCNPKVNLEEYSKGDADVSSRHEEDLYLTVQNLKFQGNIPDLKKTRTSFKYKSLTGSRKHRMFVKEIVEENFNYEEDRSQLASYFDDYVKYILSIDRSRPSSSKSSAYIHSNNLRETSAQVDNKDDKNNIKRLEGENKNKSSLNKVVNYDNELDMNSTKNNGIDDAKVTYHNSGKMKSLTISRVPSPETVQVIRVDVVCNYSSSSNISNSEDKKQVDVRKLSDKEIAKLNFKGSHFADKYLLTKTVKSVDQNLSCGSKVTLLCKTFKLSDRKKSYGKNYENTINNDTNKVKRAVH